MNEPLIAAVTELRARRDAIDHAIATLESLINQPFRPATVTAPPPRPAKPTPVQRQPKTRITRAATAIGVDRHVAARDEAILTALKRLGMTRRDKLITCMPKEPGRSEEQRQVAFRNTLTRLKVKGLIDRTGDIWSLVGVGTEDEAARG